MTMAPPQHSCSSPTSCLSQSLSVTQRIVQVTATANSHNSQGCIDSLYFLTDDAYSFGCDARAGTTFPDSSKQSQVIDFSSGSKELYTILFKAQSDCSIYYMDIYYNDPCASNPVSAITLDISAVDTQKSFLLTGADQSIPVTASSSCPGVTYSLVVSPTPATVNLIKLSSTSPYTITFAKSINLADEQVYAIELVATYSGTTVTQTSSPASFEYIDPCKTATITATAHPYFTTSVLVSQQSFTPLWFDSVSGSAASTQLCGTFTVTVTKTTKPTGYVDAHFSWPTSGLNNFLIANPTLPAEVGSYVFNFQVCLATYPTRCAIFDSSFEITPCVVTSLQVVQNSDQLSIATQTYTLSQAAVLSYALTIKQTPNCQYTSSGWSVTATGGPNPAFVSTIDSASGIYSVGPSLSLSNAGTYSIQIQTVSVNGVTYGATSSPLVAPSSFVLNVLNPCASATVTASSQTPISLTVWDAEAFYPTSGPAFSDFTDSVSTTNGITNACPITYSATVSTSTPGGMSLSVFVFDPSQKNFKISSQNYNQIGTYTVTLKGEITGFPTQFITTSFTITVQDPCPSTTLILPAVLSTITTSVLVQTGAVTKSVGVVQDQLSVLHGDATGAQYCGARQYTFISFNVGTALTALTGSEITIDPSSGLITVYTANRATTGTHTVTVSVSLVSFPTITISLTPFTVEILDCIVTAFSMIPLSPTYDQTYMIASAAISWSLTPMGFTTQVPSCGYVESYTISLSSPFQSTTTYSSAQLASSFFFSLYSRSVADAGLRTITLTSTLQSYNPFPAATAPTVSNTFTLTTTDPCQGNTITLFPSQVQDFVQFAGYNRTSQQKYIFNDQMSITNTQPTDSEDFCGTKLLTITMNGTQTSWFSAKNQDYITFSPPKNTSLIGVSLTKLVASLKSQPTVKSPELVFISIVLDSVVPLIENQKYQLGNSPLSISFEPFKVLPIGYNPGKNKVDAYIFNGVTLPEYIDLSCTCLQLVQNLEWINFNQSERVLTVSTSEKLLVGTHKIVLVQSYTNFHGVNPYTSFSLRINYAWINQYPPYFYPPLRNQVVNQCPNTTTNVWSFVLPEIIDPNNSPVTANVVIDKHFFAFNNETSKITQLELVANPANQTIKITLSNELMLQKTNKMRVQFVCKFIPNFASESNQLLDSVAKQKKWPTAYIKLIEPSGLMLVKFNQKMKIPDHPEYAQNETITLNETVYPILLIEVVPGKLSDISLLKFNWTLVEYKATELVIKLDFENKYNVSSHCMQTDAIRVTVYGFQLFADSLANFMNPGTILKVKQLPQMAPQSELEAAQLQANIVRQWVQAAVLANTLVAFLISGPLQAILDSVKQMQIIIHILLIGVAYPATSTVFFSMLMDLLNFQVYDFGEFYNRVLKLDPDSEGNSPLNEYFNRMGYSSLYIVQNFGTLCFSVFITPILWIVSFIAVKIKKSVSWFTDFNHKWTRLMFFNAWVQFFGDTYLFLTVCAGLNLYYFKWGAYGDAVNSLCTLIFGTLLIAFPFFFGIFYNLQRNYDRIINYDREFLERFGSAIAEFNFLRRGRLTLVYGVAVTIMKLWLAIIVVVQIRNPVFSVFQINFQALIMMMVVGATEPCKGRIANNMELINEGFVLIFTYHMYQFTEFMTDMDQRLIVGDLLISFSLLNIILNLGVISSQNLWLLARKLKLIHKRWRVYNQYRKNLKQNRKEQKKRDANVQFLLRWQENKLKLAKENILKQETHIRNKQLELSQANLIPDRRAEELEQLQEIEDEHKVPQQPNTQVNVDNFQSQKRPKPTRSQKRKNKVDVQRRIELVSQEQSDMHNIKQNTSSRTKNTLVEAKVKQNNPHQEEKQESSRPKSKPHEVAFDYEDPQLHEKLENLILRFPGRLKLRTMNGRPSKAYANNIEVKKVRYKNRIICFSVMMNNQELKAYHLIKWETQEYVRKQCKRALDHLEELYNDVPWQVQRMFDNGRVEYELKLYEMKRNFYKIHSTIPPAPFEDVGYYDPKFHDDNKIQLFIKLLQKRICTAEGLRIFENMKRQ